MCTILKWDLIMAVPCIMLNAASVGRKGFKGPRRTLDSSRAAACHIMAETCVRTRLHDETLALSPCLLKGTQTGES